MKKQLPTGTQTFQEFTDDNLYYVDKTEHIFKMVSSPQKCYFLARPRRFGKTLLLETIKSLFEGKSELFKDTYIYDKWDFKQNICPVIVLDFVKDEYSTPGNLRDQLISQMYTIEKRYGITDGKDFPSLTGRFCHIIETLSKKHNDVVVLIDEFDKPILDAIENKDFCDQNRKILAGIYGAIKGCSEFLRFVFVTGLTFFPKDNIGSGMNHYTNISLESEFATICGYTEKELCKVFAPELKGIDIKKVRDYYNGYSWDGKTSVYNPFAILNFLKNKKFIPWWYENYKPTALYNVLKKRDFSLLGIGKCSVDRLKIVDFDINALDIGPLLFQMGLYTITKIEYSDEQGEWYYLDFPNREVRESIANYFYDKLLVGKDQKAFKNHGQEFLTFLKLGKLDQSITPLHSLYAMFPSSNIDPSTNLEFWYASNLFYALLGNGCVVSTEDPSSKGRADIVLEDQGYVFVFELKVIDVNKTNQQASIEKAKKNAFEQIKNRGYLDKYSSVKNTIYGAALIIDKKQKNVVSLTFKQKHELDKDSK